MTTTFDIDELERLLAAATPDPAPRSLRELDERGYARRAFGNAMIDATPSLFAEIRELRAENARLREALSHAQGRFLNINIALSSGGTKREAIRIADVGEDCAKNALARAALGEPQ